MQDPEDRGRLDAPPEPQSRAQPGQAGDPPPARAAAPASPAGQASSGFDFNNPTIISLLYLGGWLTGGISALVGIVLVFVWKGEAKAEWEESHYQYLMNTFWIGLIGSFVGFILAFILIGLPILLAVGVLFVVRPVLSLVNAQKQAPMPNPGTLLA